MDQAQEVFLAPLHLSILDARFSFFEERWITMGRMGTGDVVVVAHQYFVEDPEEKIRIITARSATPKERRQNKKINGNCTMKKEYDFSHGKGGRFYSPKKISTTIRLDDDVLLS